MRKPKVPQRKPAPPKAAHAVPPGRRDTNVARARFPIVGIGSSAGGLEALEQFLGHVQAESGMAFVIVQHLDPTRKGGMVELLQRATKMKVVQVKDRTPVKPDCVYVIPPNKNMSIFHRMLHLFEPDTPRGLRLPIDYFFRALADDQQERSIGVVLSGMGSDGTLGLRAIKERGGLVVVQDPVTAKFDGMPHSAVETGLADIVAPVTELADRIKAYLEHAPTGMATRMSFEGKAKSSLDTVVLLLRSQTGHDFSLYKKSTLYRRVERRMAIHQVDRIATYVRYLQENPAEVERLFKELLISVTSFFRDAAAWTQLREEVLPSLLTNRPAGQPLRVWVPGCSTGEEAYSVAMVCKEAIERSKPRVNVALQIFATDLDREAIDRARQGFFPANIVADVESERLARFFTKEEGGYRVNKDVRETIIFAVQNLIMDPPFTRLDLLSCRNLLIYLEQELQKRLLPLFHYSLASGGFLFLGSAESIGGFTDLFTPLANKSRLFRRNETPARAEAVEFPITYPGGAGPSAEPNRTARTPLNLQTLCDQALLSRFAPAAVLTNDKGDILYISGRTGKFLEPAMGRANWNILAMAREGLRYDLMIALHKAACQRGPVAVHAVHVRTNGSEEQVDLIVEALEEPAALRGNILVMFKQSAVMSETASRGKAHPDRGPRPAHIEKELQQLREELQTTREEMQTSQEELRSANEELQSTNEELQSTNEELTTSKEEMQSLNEELQTVNAELQGKVDDLSRANSDMRNLLDSTDIATVFLDRDLNVRRFTSEATKLFKLIATDVGRPISDLVSELQYPDLLDDARRVLQTLVFVSRDVPTKTGSWYTVRIMPYRTLDDRIDGLVITFADVTEHRRATETVESQLAELYEKAPIGLAVLDADLRYVRINRMLADINGLPTSAHIGKTVGQIVPGFELHARTICAEIRKNGRAVTDYEVSGECPAQPGVRRVWLQSWYPFKDNTGRLAGYSVIVQDVTERKRAEEQRAQSPTRLNAALPS